MKKYSWIVALLVALTLGFVFASCDNGYGGDGKDPRKVVGAPPATTLGLLITGRTADYFSIDIKLEVTDGTETITLVEEDTTIIVVAVLASSGRVKMAQPDGSYSTIGSAKNVSADEEFTLENTLTAANLSGQTKVRLVQTESSGTTADIWIKSVVVKDPDGEVIFTLADWIEYNELEDGDSIPSTATYLEPLVFAGSPTVKVEAR